MKAIHEGQRPDLIKAQGNALGKMGMEFQALIRATKSLHDNCVALSGLIILLIAYPGRCPGLLLDRAVGPLECAHPGRSPGT
jgi:hypothetical protein